MGYRKYLKLVQGVTVTILFAAGFAACSSTGVVQRSPDSINEDNKSEEGNGREYRLDGREPAGASNRGDVGWLNEVEDDFGRIADETSSRTVASSKGNETLLKKGSWALQYAPSNNQFIVAVDGASYRMVQTSIGDGESFAFTAEGQAENPVTLNVSKVNEVRAVASLRCRAEVSYWNKQTHAYNKDRVETQGKACENLIVRLKEYVP
jgi:hypothetical protein